MALVMNVLVRVDKGTQADYPTIKIMMMQLLNTCLYSGCLHVLNVLQNKGQLE